MEIVNNFEINRTDLIPRNLSFPALFVFNLFKIKPRMLFF